MLQSLWYNLLDAKGEVRKTTRDHLATGSVVMLHTI